MSTPQSLRERAEAVLSKLEVLDQPYSRLAVLLAFAQAVQEAQQEQDAKVAERVCGCDTCRPHEEEIARAIRAQQGGKGE